MMNKFNELKGRIREIVQKGFKYSIYYSFLYERYRGFHEKATPSYLGAQG